MNTRTRNGSARWWAPGLAIALLSPAVLSAQSSSLRPAAIEAALQAAHAKYRDLKEGTNADYIPALAEVDSNIYGIALVTTDGKVYTVGDIASEVSIQSISKVFTLAQVIEEQGTQAVVDNMGVDATGQVFNSIVAVEQYQGARDEPDGESRRDHGHEHGHRSEPGRDLEQDPRVPTATSRVAR